MNARLIAFAVIAAVALTACGKRGTLDRPPPMWGTQAKADYAADQKKAEDEKAKKKEEEKAKREGRAVEQRDTPPDHNPISQPPDSRNQTIAQDPMDGLPSGPDSGPGNPSNLVPH
jgi:predicted small lipoprotein YifL